MLPLCRVTINAMEERIGEAPFRVIDFIWSNSAGSLRHWGAELGCSRSLWSPSLPCSRCVPRVQDQEDELANKKQGHKKKRETEMLSDGKRSRRWVQLKLLWGLPKQAAAGGGGRSEAEVAGRGDAEAAPPVPATEPAAEKKVDEEPEKGKKGKPQKSETGKKNTAWKNLEELLMLIWRLAQNWLVLSPEKKQALLDRLEVLEEKATRKLILL